MFPDILEDAESTVVAENGTVLLIRIKIDSGRRTPLIHVEGITAHDAVPLLRAYAQTMPSSVGQ